MRRAATAVLLLLFTVVIARAQTQPGAGDNPPTPTGQTVPAIPLDQIVAGTEIRATLDTPLSTRTSKSGDRFTATIVEPARGLSSIVIPLGSRLEGEVAEADDSKTIAALKDKNPLSLRFRDVVLPDGQTLPLTASLISVNSTGGANSTKAGDKRPQQATPPTDLSKGIAASGSGSAFGSPLKGLAIGALTGGGYVLSIKGKDVILPAQTGMVLRLDQPVTATATPVPPQR